MLRHRRALSAALTATAVLVAAVAVAARRSQAAPDVRLMFTGDILLARQVAVEREHTAQSPWDSPSPLFARADWVAGNLEGAIGRDSSCASPRRGCFAFDDSTSSLLANAGFHAVSIENNHAGDLGVDGRSATKRALDRAGLVALDFDRSPQFTRFGDLTVATVAITMIPDANGRAQTVPSVDVDQRLRLARALANVAVVYIHWGNELQDWPSASQRAAAEWLVGHGADVIIGHHPHVVQKPDCLHGHPVFYSLGNHVFDQKYPETKEGLIADCVVHNGRLRCAGVKTHTRRGSSMPVASGVFDDPMLGACSIPVRPSMIVSGWTLRPASSVGDSGIVLEGWRDGVRHWQTRRTSIVSFDPHLSGDGQNLLIALERHPSTMDSEIAIRPHVYEVTDRGLVAKWRGTTLAWPLLDAVVDDEGDLCALHRGDSFLRLDPSTTNTRTMRYRWNGFGFSATTDTRGTCARTFPPRVTRGD